MCELKKKICFVVPWSDHGIAGAEQQTLELIKSLDSNRFQSVLIIVTAKPGFDYSQLPKGVRCEVIHSQRIRKSVFPLLALLKKHSPDIVVSNTVSISAICALTLILSQLSGNAAKHIAVHHGGNFGSKFQRIQMLLAYLLTENYIAVSDGIRKDMRKYFGDKKSIDVIPNFFDLENIANEGAKEVLPGDRKFIASKYFIYLGRLDEHQKAVSDLLRAWKKTIESQKDIHLLILGDGDDRNLLEKICSDEKIKNVHFLGWRKNPYPYLAKAEALVLSSRYEGFGRVIVEALAVGTNVISTDCPSGPSEILDNGKYGQLVEVGERRQLELAMRAILDETKKIDSLLLQKRANNYAVSDAVKKYETIFS